MTALIDITHIVMGPALAWGAVYTVGLAVDALRWRWRDA